MTSTDPATDPIQPAIEAGPCCICGVGPVRSRDVVTFRGREHALCTVHANDEAMFLGGLGEVHP